jgi:hypothetical protein
MPKFKSKRALTIFLPAGPPIELQANEAYETNDEAEVAALKAEPEVEQINGKRKKSK